MITIRQSDLRPSAVAAQVRRLVVRSRTTSTGRHLDMAVAAASLVDSSMPVVGPPPVGPTVVLAPHPDDEVIGCGGTAASIASRGGQVAMVAITSGEATIGSPHSRLDTGARRRHEFQRAASILGASDVRALGLPDGRVAERVDELATALALLLAQVQPRLVLAPWPGDGHRDHVVVAAALAAVLPADPMMEVWGYEVHVPLPATRVVDISGVVDRKAAALAAHRTAAHAMDLDATLGLSRWRSLHARGGVGHAEAFLATTADRFPDVVAAMAGPPAVAS